MNWSGVVLLLAPPDVADARSAGRRTSSIDRLFAGTHVELRRYFNRRLGNPELAAEHTQETFLRFMKMSYRADSPDARAILFGIARNLLIDHLRRRRRQRECGLLDINGTDPQLLDEVPSLQAGVERELAGRQELALTLAAIRGLPPKCQRVFVMHRLHGLSHKDIALELGITRSTVEKHVMEAMTRLLKALR